MSSNTRTIAIASILATAGLAQAQVLAPRGERTVAAEAFAPAAAGVLNLTTDNRQQQIEIEVGPIAGEVRVFGVRGVPSGTPFTGITTVNLTTGRAQDFVEFRIFAAEVPTINLNTGLGNSDVKVIYETPFSLTPVSSIVNITGGSGNDKAAFEVISAANAFDAQWNVNLGAGQNETIANVFTDTASSFLGIDLFAQSGNGQDVLNANVISAAATLDVAFGGFLGGGNDAAFFAIDELFPAATTLNLDLMMGAGEDVAEILTVLRGGTADIAGQALGGDQKDVLKLLFDGAGSSNVTLNGGNGDDELDSEYKGAITGSPSLLGGAGNDKLKIVADQPDLLSPFVDGGPGFDESTAFGTIVNVEVVN